ncbi:MAG: hypothetical protein PW999_09710 [Paraburkholderia tropica]|nr:hypothetical protein [Paraburkholderia tropica]
MSNENKQPDERAAITYEEWACTYADEISDPVMRRSAWEAARATIPRSAAPQASAQATWETTAIANELWQLADQCGYEQFRDALSVHIKKAYQDGWQDHSNGVASVTYGEQK